VQGGAAALVLVVVLLCVHAGGAGTANSGGVWTVARGAAGMLEGVVWLLGGGMIDEKGIR